MDALKGRGRAVTALAGGFAGAMLAIASIGWAPIAAAQTLWVGTYTTDAGHETGSIGIYSLEWDARTGRLGTPQPAAATSSPSFLAADAAGRHLYAVNEDGAAQDRVSAFSIDPARPGALLSLGSVASGGSAPCHLRVDRSGRWLFVANYLSGTLAVLPIHADGSLGEAHEVVQQSGSGPDRSRQQSAHAHEVLQSEDGRFVLSVDLGADRVFVYRFDDATGHLAPADAGPAQLPAGYGPRHALFSRDRRSLYVLTELVPAIVAFRWDPASGSLVQRAVVPLLPGAFPRAGSGAEIVLAANGRTLYASHRADTHTISTFRIDADGIPHRMGVVPSGGAKPRFIGLDPDGRFLVAAHQDSGDLRVHRIDPVTGRLQLLPQRVPLPGAVMVLFGAADPR
jgi:6-phosphogluconolactonase